MRHPVDNPVITQGYQDNKNQFGYGAFGHTGIDYGVPEGTVVRAVHTGTVVDVGTNPSYIGGLYVIVSANGYKAYTGHMSRIDVSIGQAVSEGQQIGLSGMTGFVTGPHVHFQVRDSAGNLVNPLSLISNVTVPSSTGGSDVIQPNEVGNVRIINSEVEGYPFHETHRGDYDAVEMKAWVGNTYNNLIQQKWRQGQAFRDSRLAKDAFYNTWVNQVGELSTRPTRAELEALNLQLKSAHQSVLDAEARLAEQLNKPPEVIKEEVIVEKPFTDQDGMNWLRRKWQDFIARFKK